VPAIKIGSDDLTNIPLIRSYAEEKLPLILSSGMSDLSEVYDSINAAGGFDGHSVALLLCTSQYPTPPKDVNLARLHTLKSALPGITIGFSDHTKGPLASSLAVTFGATIIEKHFTLDRNLSGPDHWFSEDPIGLEEWVNSARTAYIMKGSPIVRPTQIEVKNKNEYQRHLVAACDIGSGDIFTDKNITLRRVKNGRGFPPSYLDFILTKQAPKNYKKGDPLEL